MRIKRIASSNKSSGKSSFIKHLGRGSLLSLLLLFFFLPLPSRAADIPSPPADLYVLDQASVMSDETRSIIISTSQDLARQTKAQVVVVTLDTLNDQVLEEVSLAILREWGIGDKELNNGVLILLVPSEHKSRIEVGYGLEGVLTDGKTGRIQDEYMLPYFKQEQYDQGLRNGYLAVVQEVAKEYNVTLTQNQDYQPVPGETDTSSQPTPTWLKLLGIILVILLIWLDHRFFNGFILGMILSGLFRGGGRGGGGFGGGSGGGGFGGGSGGGGGSSRGW
jgi:uncharacterized protein